MALQKKIYTTDNTGAFAEYWKVSEISGNWIKKTIDIKVSGFISQETRFNDKFPLFEKTYNLNPNLFELYFTLPQMENTDILKKCYEFLKMNSSEFTDALDV
jgi:hypothetical protein